MTQRERYHDFRYSLWLWRAFLLAVASFITSFNQATLWLVPVISGSACLCLLMSVIHRQFHDRCGPSNDCGDDHAMK